MIQIIRVHNFLKLVAYYLEKSIHSIPPTLANNYVVKNYKRPPLKKAPDTSPERRIINMGKELFKSGLEDAKKIADEKKRKKKSKDNSNFRRININNQKVISNMVGNNNSIHQFNRNSIRKIQNLKNVFNFKNAEQKRANFIKFNSTVDYQIYQKKLNEEKEKIRSENARSIFNEKFEDMPKLDEFQIYYQKGIKNRTIYPKLRKHLSNLIKLNEILDHLTPTSRVSIRNGEVVIHFKETKNNIYEMNRFKSISLNTASSKTNSTFSSLFLILLNKKYSNPPTKEELIEKMLSNPETRLMIQNAMKNKDSKIIYSDEIHSKYIKAKLGHKNITIDPHKNTKKLITDKLFQPKTFDDLMNQQEIDEVEDPSGLYTLLKNIQHRKCSCGYICIEIGTIYGDFDALKPKNVTIQTLEKENVHLIIKPVIIMNSTSSGGNNGNNNNNNDGNKNITNGSLSVEETKIKLFDEGDCDDLKISGNYPYNMLKFKEKITSEMDKKSNIQRKFYRKVQLGEELYAKDIFKQGLNMILIERNKRYKKAYERTFDTNNNALESDEMADIIEETGCSKIIVITGIGKWMGAITPKLVKQIKNIGGPDINRLITADYEDNEMADHAFILIGRKGLCAYNGVFRIKNYDISKELKYLFPNLSSDPNDCYFEDVALENLKNKQSEKLFYHNVDLRLTLNLNVDNRFAFNAPTVSQVLPMKGHVKGGTEIQIGGFNFPERTKYVWEILIRGVPCKNIVVLSPNQIKCITGESDFMGAGFGNAIVKLKNGLSSPSRTCPMFQYYGTIQKKAKAKVNIHVNSTMSFPCYEDRQSRFKKLLLNKPCFPVYTNSTVRGTYLIIKKN